jgi:hypothetical protein
LSEESFVACLMDLLELEGLLRENNDLEVNLSSAIRNLREAVNESSGTSTIKGSIYSSYVSWKGTIIMTSTTPANIFGNITSSPSIYAEVFIRACRQQ